MQLCVALHLFVLQSVWAGQAQTEMFRSWPGALDLCGGCQVLT